MSGRPFSEKAYLPCWEGQAHVSASSTLISCIAQRGLVGVRLSFGDAAGAIFAGFLVVRGFFIDAAAACRASRKKIGAVGTHEMWGIRVDALHIAAQKFLHVLLCLCAQRVQLDSRVL